MSYMVDMGPYKHLRFATREEANLFANQSLRSSEIAVIEDERPANARLGKEQEKNEASLQRMSKETLKINATA